MKIPTQKGNHSCEYIELSFKQKEGNGWCVYIFGRSATLIG